MPTIPKIKVLTNTSVDVLNAIRNSATTSYRDYVPIATPDAESIKEIGNIIMDYPALQNEFLNVLINRIGKVIITSKMFANPWAAFKQGILNYGETIEEIYVNLIKSFQFDPGVAESEVFKREKPDVRSAFHILNYKKFYKVTIEQEQLRQAFLSFDGINNLVTKIIEQIYTSANYDEFNVMKYMVGKMLLDGRLYPVTVPQVTTANMRGIVSKIKGTSNRFEFMSSEYNVAGVANHALKENQYLLVSSEFDAEADVEVLAMAFNMNKAEFMGHKVLLDSFGTLDWERLDDLFDGDDNYSRFTAAEIAALDTIPAVLVTDNWFMVYDNLNEFRDQQNGQGLYWNYFYHVWKTFSVSPFANAAVFVPATPTVTSVTVTPATVTISAGGSANFTAVVVASGFAPKDVTWSVDATAAAAGVKINGSGYLTVPADASVASVTVTATSTFDSTKTDTATVTVTRG